MRESPTFAPAKQEIPKTTEQVARMIIALGEELTQKELYPYQYDFALAILATVLEKDGKAITALFCRQSGKTETVALVAVAASIMLPALAKKFPHDRRVRKYKRGFWVGIYAPKDDQAKLAFERVRTYANSEVAEQVYADQDINSELDASSSDRVMWSSGSKVRARTASDNSVAEGETWDLIICDESQNISARKIDKELKPMLKSTGGPMVYIGTTGGASGYFHRRIKLNLEQERDNNDRRHFEANYVVVCRQRRARFESEARRWNTFIKASPKAQHTQLEKDPRADQPPDEDHLEYEKSLQSDITEWGGIDKAELNETFQLNYMLKWGSNSLIAVPPDKWHQLAVPSLELNMTGTRGFLVAGLDLAKGVNEGSDQSVLAILHVDVNRPIVEVAALPGQDAVVNYRKTLVGLYTFRGDFENVQNDAVVSTCRMYPGLKRLVIDSNGIGDPVASRLANLLPEIEVEPMSWASVANKSLCQKLWLMALKGKHFYYAAGPETRTMVEFRDMEDQVLGLQKRFVGQSSLMVLEAQEGEHDDYPDALSFACYACDQAVDLDKDSTPEIEISHHSQVGHSYQQSQGPMSRADSYRTGRRGRSRYDAHRGM